MQLLRPLRRRRHSRSGPAPARGAVIPLPPGSADVPQGLGYDPDQGEFVYTFYAASDPGRGRLVFADGDGTVSASADLTGLHHYGGVTVHAGCTYVCGGGAVQVHDTTQLRQGRAEPLVTVPVRASSTITSYRCGLYVARFHRSRPGRMYRYELDDDGVPVDAGVVFTVPPRTQGVAFAVDGTVYFSRSWGRARASVLTRVAATDMVADGGWTAQNGQDTRLPPMAEGSVVVDGYLHQLYESGARPYRRYRRAHLMMSVLRGRLVPREHLSVHEVGGLQTRGNGEGGSP